MAITSCTVSRVYQPVSPVHWGPMPTLQNLINQFAVSQFAQEKLLLEKKESFFDSLCLPPGNQLASLNALLTKITMLSPNQQDLLDKIHQACFKKEGYFSRLFGRESWTEWTESRTSLGRVLAAFQEHTETLTSARVLVKRFDETMLRKADVEAEKVLTQSESRMQPTSSQSWSGCAVSMITSTVAARATNNPVHMLWGLGGCLSTAWAQTPIGSQFVVVNTTNGVGSFNPLNSGQFVAAWGVDNPHNVTETNVFGNPSFTPFR